LDGPTVLRLALAPAARADECLARRLVDDMTDPVRGVLKAGRASVEAPAGALVREVLLDAGWHLDEPWTPLRRDLASPVEDPGVRIEVIGREGAPIRAAVQRAAFETSTFSDDRWHAMSSGPAYAFARCLVAHDAGGDAVAAVTVWSAGPGKPGLLEPLGVHRDHRRLGFGTAISLAAAAVLRQLGSSSAIVCTSSSNVGAVATYRSAGFRPLPATPDIARDGGPASVANST
jgi:ribosomal protein S18 acetylase RimI-like enzyme